MVTFDFGCVQVVYDFVSIPYQLDKSWGIMATYSSSGESGTLFKTAH